MKQTEKKIEEGNKIIAVWMSGNVGEKAYRKVDGEITEAYSFSKLKYHSSWDWLMPAIDKFNNLWIAAMESDMPRDKFAEFDKHRIDVDNAVCTYDLTETFNVFTRAIQWYNQQTKLSNQ